MNKIHSETVVAGFALLAFAFLFVMTATEGKYWGSTEMDEYIIKITEGEEQAYLDAKTPTAMVIREQDKGEEICAVAKKGYAISHGQAIARITYIYCESIE